MISNIELELRGKAKDLGDHFMVRRSLPDKNKRMVGPFIFWDHMGPMNVQNEEDVKVRAHPHIGLATITYLMSGEMLHRDSLGNEQLIRPGEVNWMTAGKGIVHSERANPERLPCQLEGIQLWMALPKEHEDIEPNFYHCKEKDLPLICQDHLQLRLIAGTSLGYQSPVPVYSSMFYFHGITRGKGKFHFDLPPNTDAAIYLTAGVLEAEGKSYEKFDLIVFKQDSHVTLSFDEKCEFMFFGGEPFPEKRHIWWNFVSSDKNKIEQAKDDWREGKFPPVINEKEKVPLPEDD